MGLRKQNNPKYGQWQVPQSSQVPTNTKPDRGSPKLELPQAQMFLGGIVPLYSGVKDLIC